ncbi:peptide-N(4)-(N-acetyl-beta-glucosaminyl)asparagine amidase-like isoform X1 [Clavelina lepadiformis]|uniref:peptide-N(4)-(N-acetyl-beta- glucosaminyl)asparagine amidase-like isoform X1 n=2 Tax=Clavelina lepadiformis TaxID=159417 RepID=UPI0040413797
MSINSAGVTALLNNERDNFLKASSTLIRIASNILKNRNAEKFRSVRIDSKAFQEKILPFNGAVQCLLDMGFQEDGERFTLPMDNSLINIQDVHCQLLKATENDNKNTIPEHISNSQKVIMGRLRAHFENCLVYENKSLQNKARLIIPAAKLNQRAQSQFSRIKTGASAVKVSFHHFLLLELLTWFKRDFFTWTDVPKCTNCDSSKKALSIGMLSPTQEDFLWGASRVEGFRCQNCQKTLRFPRYNHPEKLLETRTGRCGEWANCFTLMCRSMGFEARHVLDWTDHVWTEIFIPPWDRWVHCDPCENACDKPLMYEKGWNKKLSLIVAANSEEIVDVTWRYSRARAEVTARRNEMFDAAWLDQALKSLNKSQTSIKSETRKRELERRSQIEKYEFESSGELSDQQYGGRTSGSLAWRLARGEIHSSDNSEGQGSNKLIEPTDTELASGSIQIEYCCKADEYTRISNNKETIYSWDALVYRCRSMMRKEEFDWKQAYLCRVEGNDLGHIAWKFSMPKRFKIVDIRVKVQSTTFENGNVGWLLCSDSTCDVIAPGEEQSFYPKYQDASTLSIHGFLRGGLGDHAWQKAQLFRVSTNDLSTPPAFSVLIKFSEVPGSSRQP